MRHQQLATCGLCSRDSIFNIFMAELIKQGAGDKFSLWKQQCAGGGALELKRYQGFSSNIAISMKGHKFNVNYAKGIHIKK